MLEVATRLFAERGFNAVSMEEIAEEVGVTKPMLYAYFDSKEGLYLACIQRAGEPLLEAIRGAIDPAEAPESQLWAGLEAFFGFIDEHRALWSALFVEASARGGAAAAQLAKVRDEIIGELTQLLARTATGSGVAPELKAEIEFQSFALMGAVEALASWWLEHPEAPRDLMALRAMNFAWMGFGDLLEGRLWLPPARDGAREARR